MQWWLTTLIMIAGIYRIKIDSVWLYGLYQTLFTKLFARRPDVFKNIVQEEIEAPDGEKYVLWWSSKMSHTSFKSSDETRKSPLKSTKKIWILLPGSMTSADTFYTWDAIDSGLFAQDPWCIFHNPGIVNMCHKRAPPALTDITYIEHFVHKLKKQGMQASIIGFSAGAMLTISMAKRADHIDVTKTSNDESRTLDCCVAIHGPDRIRDVWEYCNETYSRFDVLFSLSLYRTMCRSGCTKFLPVHAGGGLHNQRFPWLGGYYWAKRYLESVFQTPWDQMEDTLWSCSPALSSPIHTPVMRVQSLNDPIVNFSRCCNTSHFSNINKVYLQPEAGHCCAFRYDKNLASHIRRWRDGIMQQNAKEENISDISP